MNGYTFSRVPDADLFNTAPAAIATNFHASDIGFIKKALGHCLENIGNGDLVYMKVFGRSASKRCRCWIG
jgi:oxalate decarboxylase/phosphoglucose isomerase-like protein (cupin superfamily)